MADETKTDEQGTATQAPKKPTKTKAKSADSGEIVRSGFTFKIKE
jgi:hypothetical protein